jgi:hypothetical protein
MPRRHEEWRYSSIIPHISTRWRCVQLHASAVLLPEKSPPGTHWIGGWVGPKAGVDAMEKRKNLSLPEIELWFASP